MQKMIFAINLNLHFLINNDTIKIISIIQKLIGIITANFSSLKAAPPKTAKLIHHVAEKEKSLINIIELIKIKHIFIRMKLINIVLKILIFTSKIPPYLNKWVGTISPFSHIKINTFCIFTLEMQFI